MSATSPQHHDTAAENVGRPATVTPGAAGGQQATTSPFHDDRIDSAATAAAAATTTTTATHPSPYNPHDDNAAGDAETLAYPPLLDPSQPLLPPANFSPFFTLVEDATTTEHHHPSVHYVFSDDDPDLHTAVFMRALGDTAAASPSAHKHPHDDDANNVAVLDILPPPAPGVRERFVVVDLTPDGQGVAGATSLSRDWQVVGTVIAPAPSFAEDSADEAAGGGALMLRVEGTEIASGKAVGKDEDEEVALALAEARKTAEGDLVGGMEDLLQRFDGGVDILNKVVGPDVEVLVSAERTATATASAGEEPGRAGGDGAQS
ncbi:hypothetical protein B0J12DRAFT_661059 [Macrophomina phaseolina]|uniref:Uncharacterized protein n=1 Tax=Macrophomina phaseolina TaxID=35725 RepID=A0ABQ8GD53_9PEZI|nr:hypothetical protein B0J12DRAFT_661059 [Macrophomina phaseolina]